MNPKFDKKGLVPVVVQDRLTGEVRMLAWMNADALHATRRSGFATFWSRSRNELWEKGATSGNRLRVAGLVADCDADTLLLLADPEGPTCHTGRPSCFFTSLVEGQDAPEAQPYLLELERVIAQRASSTAERSYTRALLEGGAQKISEKIAEEASELGRALIEESDERVASEAADVVYHLLVGLRLRGVSFRAVVETLERRAGTSGHAEKARRKPPEV